MKRLTKRRRGPLIPVFVLSDQDGGSSRNPASLPCVHFARVDATAEAMIISQPTGALRRNLQVTWVHDYLIESASLAKQVTKSDADRGVYDFGPTQSHVSDPTVCVHCLPAFDKTHRRGDSADDSAGDMGVGTCGRDASSPGARVERVLERTQPGRRPVAANPNRKQCGVSRGARLSSGA